MKLTLSIDQRTAEEARKAAAAMGKSLNQVVRDYLELLAGRQDLQAQLEAFEASAKSSPGRRDGWKFSRDVVNPGE